MRSVQRPEIVAGDSWRYAVENRLSAGSAEETRRVLEVAPDRIVCELRSTAAGAASGRYVYTREWNLLERPALAAPGESEQEAGTWRWWPHYPKNGSYPGAASVGGGAGRPI